MDVGVGRRTHPSHAFFPLPPCSSQMPGPGLCLSCSAFGRVGSRSVCPSSLQIGSPHVSPHVVISPTSSLAPQSPLVPSQLELTNPPPSPLPSDRHQWPHHPQAIAWRKETALLVSVTLNGANGHFIQITILTCNKRL